MKTAVTFRFRVPLLITSLLLLLVTGVWSVMAQDGVLPLPGNQRAFSVVQELTVSDALPGDAFGKHLALDGNTLLIGSEDPGVYTGAAYIFERDETGQWQAITRLYADEMEAYEQLGQSVALQGEIAVVGAPTHVDPTLKGIVYVFGRDSIGAWVPLQLLAPNDLPNGSLFGSGVDIDGDRIVAASTNGSAYVYKRDPVSQLWQLEDILPVGGESNDIDIEGETILIGADSENGSEGAAYVYQLQAGSWTLIKKLLADDGQANDGFGQGVMLQHGQAFVYAPLSNLTDANRGAVYNFSEDGGTWTQIQKLVPNDINANDYFGNDFALEGETLIVGSFGDASDAGSVYIFGWNGSAWIQQRKIAAVGGRFGYSVALQGNLIFAGAPATSSNLGKVYVYSDSDLIPTTIPTVELVSDGGFESAAAGWDVKDSTSDKVKCNKEGKVIAYAGNCAWMFKGGAGENSKIQQVITSGTNAGDTLTLSGYVNGKGAVDSKVKVVVSYAGGVTPKDKLSLDIVGDTGGLYYALSDFVMEPLTINLPAAPEKIKLQVKNSSTSGKLYYDALSLSAQ